MLSKFFSWAKTLLKRLIDWFKGSEKKEDEEVLKKELLLCGGGKSKTHTITVGYANYGNYKLVGYDDYFCRIFPGFYTKVGSLTPNTIDGKIIYSLNSDTNDSDGSNIFIEGTYSNSTKVIVTRKDTGDSFTFSLNHTEAGGGDLNSLTAFECKSVDIFSDSDVGKTIDLIIEIV